MRAGKYNDDVEILLGFNEEEGHMVTSIFEAFPLLYSAMAAGWPILGESPPTFAKPLFSHDSPSALLHFSFSQDHSHF